MHVDAVSLRYFRALFGTNAKNRRELSTLILRNTSSLAPAAFSFGRNAVTGLPYARNASP